jgi:two-component system sensor histidine kinase KdpD
VAIILRLRNFQTVPFHLVWVSMGFLYGLKVWKPRMTLLALFAVCAVTGEALIVVVLAGNASWDEVTQVPLMAAMFAAMAWHAHRRQEAMLDAEAALRREQVAVESLKAADQLKNTFLQAVSHELRTPLSAILGYALTLRRADLDLPMEERGELAERLAVNAIKLERLLSDLLDLDRLERGIMEPRRRTVDVGELIRTVVDQSDPMSNRVVSIEVDPVTLALDGPKLERIVENLLANAAKYSPPESPIRVLVEPSPGGVLIAVEDRGPGVPDEFKGSIFEPFRQGPATSSHAPGTGIGLSLVTRFAELHGGRAWVEDRPEGGASFRVFLSGPGSVAPVGPDPALV